MIRIVAEHEHDPIYLIETGEHEGHRVGRVYDARSDELREKMFIATIASRGGWVEPTIPPGERKAIEREVRNRIHGAAIPH